MRLKRAAISSPHSIQINTPHTRRNPAFESGGWLLLREGELQMFEEEDYHRDDLPPRPRPTRMEILKMLAEQEKIDARLKRAIKSAERAKRKKISREWMRAERLGKKARR